MSKAKQQAALLDLVESDSEDGLTTRVAKMPAAKKPRGRPAANKVTKPAPKSTRRVSGRLAEAVDTEAGRAALAEKSTNQQPAVAKRGRKPAAKDVVIPDDGGLATPPNDNQSKAKGRGRPKAVKPEPVQEVPDSVQQRAAPAAKRGRKPAKELVEEEMEDTEIQETQEPDVMDLDLEDSEQVEDLPAFPRAVTASVQRTSYQAPPSAIRRPLSASDNDSDPSVRRRLGDMTKKYETLEAKYRDLRDIAVREAERNFDRLKKQGDERAQSKSVFRAQQLSTNLCSAANQLIASLKSEVAAQKELVKEGASFKKQFETSEAKIDNLQARITELTTALSESKNEMKTLSAKLSAARAAEAANAKVPGSAMKNGAGGARATASSETVHSTQLAQLKEDLYGDLTGLIVRSVKRDGPEDTFDCIQTGRGRSKS